MNFSGLIKRFMQKSDTLNLYSPEHVKLVKKVYGSYNSERIEYEKMYRYYKGDTDAMRSYKFLTKRSNLKTNVNYIKKFIQEEVSYIVGNKITYESKSNNIEFIRDIDLYTFHWNELHDSDLMKYMKIFTKAYELYYLDNELNFCSKIIKPTDGYAYCDNSGKILFFIHTYKNEFDTTNYIDIYTNNYIYHLDSKFEEISKPTQHIFNEVPVSVGNLTDEGIHDSLYKDIKGLQDAFETNLSDIGNEIADFRNAYLIFMGCKVDEPQLEEMKRLGILQSNTEKAKISWLTKDINDTFIQNTLDRYVDTMYQISCHINHNEKMQSNLSGVALRSRLISLENKCTLGEYAHRNVIKNRLRFLCKYLDVYKNKEYDYKDIKSLYTPNIPQDDIGTADLLSKVPEYLLSKDTARGLFSFINNPGAEGEKVEKEKEEDMTLMGDLDE